MAETITSLIQLRRGLFDATHQAEFPELQVIPATYILEQGEACYEVDKQRLKIGDGVTQYSDLQYIGGESSSKEQFWSVIAAETETDEQAIERAVGTATLQQGDICVVKRLIADGKYQYTAYVYDKTGHWQAMDGNYSAENVYFKSDFMLAGNYTQIGNITKGISESKNLPAAGKSVKELFSTIFTMELNPTVTQPTFNVTSSNIGTYEVGENVAVKYQINTTAGSYQYGPSPTGVVFSDLKATLNGQTLSGESGTFDAIQITDAGEWSITATGKSSAGAVPKTNIGNDYPAGQILAKDDWNKSKGTLSGFRKWFWGYKTGETCISDPTAITSEQIRGLGNFGNSEETISEKLLTTTSMQQIFIAIPHSLGKTTVTIKNAYNPGPQKVYKIENTVDVTGANNYSSIKYDVWYVSNAAPDSSENTYHITIT